MEGLVRRGHPVRVVVVPVATDIVGGLEAVVGDAVVLQPLGGGDAGAARADDAYGFLRSAVAGKRGDGNSMCWSRQRPFASLMDLGVTAGVR